jgi:hypothetical protein
VKELEELIRRVVVVVVVFEELKGGRSGWFCVLGGLAVKCCEFRGKRRWRGRSGSCGTATGLDWVSGRFESWLELAVRKC